MLTKQPVSVFFGTTDQDTSKKGVKLADLVTAQNCQQLKVGELTKREGFTETAQTYESKSAFTPEAFCCPDGSAKLVRDAADDVVYAQGPVGGEWKSKGGTQRLLCKSALRFPSTASDTQLAPMIKQSGDWFVWLDDSTHFRYAKQDADGVRLLYLSDPIAVAGPTAGAGTSTHVSSFCVVQNATFDAANIWVFWVDWTTNTAQQNRDGVWALKIPLDGSATSQILISAGTGANTYILTGITATYVGGALWLAQCGIFLQAGSAVDFRSSSFTTGYGWSQHFTVTSGGVAGAIGSYTRTSTARSWIASGICMLTTPEYNYATSPARLRYAFWSKHATDSTLADLVLVSVLMSDGTATAYTVDSADLDSAILPATLTTNHNYVGAVTGREYATGCYIVASVRVSAENDGTAAWADVGTNTADRIFTKCYDYSFLGPSVSTRWAARGAWLAHGLFRRTDDAEFIITGWQDTDEIQMPYHLRRFTDGAIVTQFAYGEGAYPGGCGLLAGQFTYHVGDLQQPYLSKNPYSESYPSVVLATTSANVTGTVDMAALTISRPSYQNPTTERGLALAPGGTPTISGGWQNNQEAGPLVYPSGVGSYWGAGSS